MASVIRARPESSGGPYRVEGAHEDISDANAFLVAVELRGLSPRTVRAYAMDLVIVLRWMTREQLRVRDLTERVLLDFVRGQRVSNAAPRSINRRLTVIRLLYRFITDQELKRGPGVNTVGDPFRARQRDRFLGIHRVRPVRRQPLRVKLPRTLIEPLDVKAVHQFIRRCKRYRDLAIVYLMLLCGLRSAEVLALRVNDLSLDERRIRVWGKGSKERAMPLPTLLLQLLQDYVQLERPDVATTTKLFVVLKGKHRGRAMTPSGLRSLFRYRRREQGLEKANAHRFRHTFGADMARAGVRLPVLQRMMGHAHPETTVQYIQLSVADVAAEYERASARIRLRYANRGKSKAT